MYLRQNSQMKSFWSLTYSWGYGDEYQVSISYLPNSMAAGHLIAGWAPGDSKEVDASLLSWNTILLNQSLTSHWINITLASHKRFGCRFKGVKMVVTNCLSASSWAFLKISLSDSVGMLAGRFLIGGDIGIEGVFIGATVGVLTGRGLLVSTGLSLWDNCLFRELILLPTDNTWLLTGVLVCSTTLVRFDILLVVSSIDFNTFGSDIWENKLISIGTSPKIRDQRLLESCCHPNRQPSWNCFSTFVCSMAWNTGTVRPEALWGPNCWRSLRQNQCQSLHSMTAFV